MINDRIKEWVGALRGGEFEQGRCSLRDDTDKYCCLGVACEIYRRATGKGIWTPTNTDDPLRFELETEIATGLLPHAVRQYFGLTTTCGRYFIDGRMTSLCDANDAGGLSFEQIADIIESNPKGLLT